MSSATAVIYVRVSTADQVENLSLDTQEQRCREFCKRQGLKVERVFREEGASAKTTERQKLQEMFDHLKVSAKALGITAVVIYKVDRFSRVVRDYQDLLVRLAELNVSLHSATELFDDSPSGRLQENVLASFAQFDNDQRSARTKDGMRSALILGRWVWKTPIGYIRGERTGASMVIDPLKAHLVLAAFERVANGESRQVVREELASVGLQSTTGKPLSKSRFDDMIKNPLYKGRILHPSWEIDVAGDFEAIVSEELWNSANSIRKRRGKATPVSNAEFPLRRIVTCSFCGYKLTGSKSKGRNFYYPYYSCWNLDCRRVSIRSETLESIYEDYLATVSIPKPILDLFEATLMEELVRRQKISSRLQDESNKKLATVEQRLRVLTDHYLDQKIDDDLFAEHQLRLKAEIGELKILRSKQVIGEVMLKDAIEQSRAMRSYFFRGEVGAGCPAIAYVRSLCATRSGYRRIGEVKCA